MKKYGEDIIQTKVGELEIMRGVAKKLTVSKNHSWANIYYIDSQSKKLTSETYTDGKLFNINRDQLRFPGNTWWDSKITILEAMAKFSEHDFVKKNSIRLLERKGV
ncbi:MAG: hypothetical protein ACHQYP_05885 [Nitrospiria bacterium]